MAMTGARRGTAGGWQRLFSRAMSKTLTAFVVPDTRTARAFGLDLAAAGLQAASNPRHASVLLVLGDLPEGFSNAATVAYAQMPRPRAVLTVGANHQNPVLPSDISTSLDQEELRDGVHRLQGLFRDAAWSPAAQAFDAPILADAGSDDDGDMHAHMHHGGMQHNSGGVDASGDQESDAGDSHEEAHDESHMMPSGGGHHHGDASGSMPHTSGKADAPSTGASDHSAMLREDQRSSSAATVRDDHADADHDAMNHDMHEMDHGEMNHSDHAMQQQHSADRDESGHGDHAMDHSSHMMDDSGFMSMIAMTQDLPRSRDGLPMEWIEAGFGPLFSSLPGGLAPVLTLDGDTVAQVTLTRGITNRAFASTLPGPVTTLPDRLARLDPLTPIAYRQLAIRAVASMDQKWAAASEDAGSIGTAEHERATSHLGWLAAFGELLGNTWMADQAAVLHLDLVRAQDLPEVERLRPAIDRFLRQVVRAPLLRSRLSGIGIIDQATANSTSGPITRASGLASDARESEAPYLALGFHPVQHDMGDAFARMWVRVQEIEQSLDLVAAVNSITLPSLEISPDTSGTGMAAIETPRGRATLHIEVHKGSVHSACLETPSAAHVALLPGVTQGAELADALAAIASLDLSPWEMDA